MDHSTKTSTENTDTSNTAPPQAKIDRRWPEVKSFRFEDVYDHTIPMENTHEESNIIDTQEQKWKRNYWRINIKYSPRP